MDLSPHWVKTTQRVYQSYFKKELKQTKLKWEGEERRFKKEGVP